MEFAEAENLVRSVELPAGGQARADWRVRALHPGDVRIVMRLLTDEESDATAVTLPVAIHGSRKFTPFGGILADGEKETAFSFRVPAQRSAGQSRIEATLSPSVAAAMLDALPYLLDYPYGCTEQTLNRFLPAVMTRAYLDRLGRSLSEARSADARKGIPQAWRDKFNDTRPTPVFDDAKLAVLVEKGVNLLANMQNDDGGWGWFSGQGEQSWPHTTAVVMHGLLTAKEHDAAIPDDMLEKGVAWLEAYRNRQITRLETYRAGDRSAMESGKALVDNMDAFVQLVLARANKPSQAMRDRLFQDRRTLSLSALAMLGILLFEEHASDELAVVLDNLLQYLEEDGAPGGVRLRIPGRGRRWYNDAVETHAWFLKLLARTDPGGVKAAGIARHLLRNRKNGGYWHSTRDTAYAVEALAEYASASGESAPDMTVSIYLDGNKVLERAITPENLLEDVRLVLEGPAVESGEHEIRIVRSGNGAVHYSGGLTVFSLEDPITKVGGELKIGREYYILPADSGSNAEKPDRERRIRITPPIEPDSGGGGVLLRPGDLVEVELKIESDDEYEYLVFEDMKAAGCEAVATVSGYGGDRLGAYVEYRDRKVVLFIRSLPAGEHAVSYRLRAETPGRFSALPVFGGGMYATDLFANSDELKIRIED